MIIIINYYLSHVLSVHVTEDNVGLTRRIRLSVTVSSVITTCYSSSLCVAIGTLQAHKWENAMTIDRSSWGYRREATITDYLSIQELISELVSTVRYSTMR